MAALDRANVDTDQIIPKQFLKSIARTGFGENLFFDWRYLPDGKSDPKFPLNRPEFNGASILAVRNNFGCGSSREHAVWAIQQYGFQAVVAPWQNRGGVPNVAVPGAKDEGGGVRVPAFADIFKNNCSKNALLTIELSEAEVDKIFDFVDRFPGLEATVNLDEQRLTLHLAEEVSFHFDVDPSVKARLIHGLNDIGLTLKHETAITAFEKKHNSQIYK